MALISLQAVSFDYGREPILQGVDVTILSGVKYALVGVNGVGKTTLLAALHGELPLPETARQVAGATRVGMLHQETALDPTRGAPIRTFDGVARAAFAAELDLEAELEKVAGALASGRPLHGMTQEELIQRQGRLQSEYERRDGYTWRSRLEAALRGVGLGPELWDLPIVQLSGGERRRAALAAILLSDADVLLLDEPTNHLDLQACEWLEDFLQQYRGAAVLVSHDRQFLDRVADRTLHLERGRVTLHSGNYSFFEQAYRQELLQQRAAYARQKEKIRRLEEYVSRNIAGQKTKQAQSRRKQLAREIRLEKPPGDTIAFKFYLKPLRPSGGMVLEAEKLTRWAGGRFLFRDLDLRISRGDRIGIIGPNGCGKTTLLKILSGRMAPDGGVVRRGHNVDLGLYDQQLGGVVEQRTVIDEMAAVDPAATLGELRDILAAFGFTADMIDRPVGKLSGGERGRLALLRLVKEGHNTLLLDEPTNHLDVRSSEALEAALMAFDGTLVVVSHDRRFLDKTAGRLLVFDTVAGEEGVVQYLGNYTDYRRRRDEEQKEQREGQESREDSVTGRTSAGRTGSVRSPSERSGATKLSKNEQVRRRRWIAAAEEEITGMEKERAELLAAMSDATLSSDQRRRLGHRCSELQKHIAEKMAVWEKWNLEIEEATEDS
jgi:ATP-binding cassette subfamily F protein 3